MLKRKIGMAIEQIRDFFNQVKEDQKLQERIATIQAEIMQNQTELSAEQLQDESTGKMISLAESAGFSFSKDELTNWIQDHLAQNSENEELSDEELETVAGGGLGQAILASVAGFGLYCAAASVGALIFGDDCGEVLREC